MVTLRASASFCLSPNFGARIRTHVPPVDQPRSTHIHLRGGASTARCRTSKTSAKPLNVPKAGPCTLRNPAGFGSLYNAYDLSYFAPHLGDPDRRLGL